MASHFQAFDFTSWFTEKVSQRRSQADRADADKQKVNAFSAVTRIPLHTNFASEVVVSPNVAPAFAQLKFPMLLFEVNAK